MLMTHAAELATLERLLDDPSPVVRQAVLAKLKAAAAGMPFIAAVSAPTALAVDLARACGLTLVGFARPGRQVVYSHPQRFCAAGAGDAR